jgi:hypothetical protein
VLVGAFGPLQHEIEPHGVVLRQRERRLVHRFGASLGDDLSEIVGKSLAMLEDDPLTGRLVRERHLHPGVQIAGDFEPCLDHRRVEFDLRKDRRVRPEVDCRPRPAGRADLLHPAHRLPLLEAHLPLGAVALHRRDELLRQGVDDAGADAVETARCLVGAVLELAAGVQHREDDFERALVGRGMSVDRNAPAIVLDRDRGPVGVERDPDVRRVAVHRLVDGVVEHFPDQMMESRRPDAADVHAGALADGLEALEDRDVFRRVVGWGHRADCTVAPRSARAARAAGRFAARGVGHPSG